MVVVPLTTVGCLRLRRSPPSGIGAAPVGEKSYEHRVSNLRRDLVGRDTDSFTLICLSSFLQWFDRIHLSSWLLDLDGLRQAPTSAISLRVSKQHITSFFIMENAFVSNTAEVLKQFRVTEEAGLSSIQVAESREKYGSNSLPEDPPTPLWQLVLEQFKDQLVIILLGSAAISFVLALFEEGDDWTAFVDPVVVSSSKTKMRGHRATSSSDQYTRKLNVSTDFNNPDPERCRRSDTREQR